MSAPKSKIVACGVCGAEFRVFNSQLRKGGGKYCSRDCHNASKVGRPSYERTPEHREKMSERFKGRPAIPHAVEAAAAARRGVPPTEKARAASSARWRGEGNPNWQDGRSHERYAPGFFGRRVRDEIIERDVVCRGCGEWDDRPKAMHVHHVDGGRDNHDPENLVLLCVGCHKARHAAMRRAAA